LTSALLRRCTGSAAGCSARGAGAGSSLRAEIEFEAEETDISKPRLYEITMRSALSI
jgi:hypothetical protein